MNLWSNECAYTNHLISGRVMTFRTIYILCHELFDFHFKSGCVCEQLSPIWPGVPGKEGCLLTRFMKKRCLVHFDYLEKVTY